MPVSMTVENRSFKNCTLVTGFHGIGETGYIAISYFVNASKAQRIGFINVAHPPPFVATSDAGLITPFELYKSRNLVFVKLEFSPHKSEESEFSKTLARWAISHRFKDAVLIGGLDSSFKSGKHEFRIVPTEAYLPKAKRFNAPKLEPGLFVFGPLAVMLSEFEINKFPAVAVLPYATLARVDPGAAAIAIKNICRTYRLKVDVKDLETDAKEIETELENRIKQTKQSLQGMYL